MTINIICTSKPADGLFYYSYEHCSLLNAMGIPARLVVICHRSYAKEEYIKAIQTKYIHFDNVYFDCIEDNEGDIALIMGRSMITLAFMNFNSYTDLQKQTLSSIFSKNLISVYSENHPLDYPKALSFFCTKDVVDLCDHDVYPGGVGDHFEKRINFKIYKPYTDDTQFKYLFLGTNDKYYATVEAVIDQFSDHGILTYNEKYINKERNNVFAPVENLLGIFEAYVYTKNTFDPAPRILQECKYFNKEVVYLRDKNIVDGGSVYWSREIKEIDISPILNALERLK